MYTFVNKEKMLSFVKVGIVSLVLLVAVAGLVKLAVGVTEVVSAAEERKLPIYCVDTDEKKVALSFDAAWGNSDTSKILDILGKQKVKVTFFMTGGWIEKYPDDVKTIAAAGHDLGNHSENHKQMSQLSADSCRDELMKPHEKVKALTGIEMNLFRPPYGDYNNPLIKTANEDCGYHVVQWDVEGLDLHFSSRGVIRKVFKIAV